MNEINKRMGKKKVTLATKEILLLITRHKWMNMTVQTHELYSVCYCCRTPPLVLPRATLLVTTNNKQHHTYMEL